MKAILPITRANENEIEMLMFDTDTATELCNVTNAFGYHVKTIYLSKGGILFAKNNNRESLEVLEQHQARKYIGKNYPDIYEKHFGQVKEA